jgi:H+-translocating NAD(P) transhydrogenase subunit beta
MTSIVSLAYLISGICFIMALRGLASPETARNGNLFGIFGMALAIVTTLFLVEVSSLGFIALAIAAGGGIGAIVARKIKMTALPQLVAAFHSLVGMAAVLVASAAFLNPSAYGIGQVGSIHPSSLIEMGLGVAIGAITFTGSVVAFAKLQGLVSGKPLIFKFQHHINLALLIVVIVSALILVLFQEPYAYWTIVGASLLLGFLLILPIGGADMPVVISMLNSYSGWAAAATGFTLKNPLLIITGALVGSSGAILSYIMCKGMNRSILNVILGGFGTDTSSAVHAAADDRPVKVGSADDAAFVLKNASSVVIVPGYGMAVAQAQHTVREMADLLKEAGIRVRYAIHPVAGRMPGHMNVLLAEAGVSYDDVLELDEINRDFAQTDVAFVVGANDVTNPAAHNDPQSPIYGMPVLDVEKAKTVLFVKRSMATGYAGVENELFFRANTMMLFGDAKQMCEHIVRALEQ